MAIITSPDYILLDGISSESVGLYVDTPPVPPFPRQKYTTWKTGIDTDFAAPDDVWEPVTLTFSCYAFFKKENFNLKDIYSFISGKRSLRFSRFPDRFFKILQIGGVTPGAQYDGQRLKLAVSFVCDPFKYHVNNAAVTPSGGIVTNPGTRFSRPIYKISASFMRECTLTVNGQALKIDSFGTAEFYPSAKITVDAEKMIAYKTDAESDGTHKNLTQHTTGFFPFLNPGKNLVQITNGSVEMIGNWRDF